MTADKPEGARLKQLLEHIVARYVPYDIADRIAAWPMLETAFKDYAEPPILAWAEQNPDAVKALLEKTGTVVKTEFTEGDKDFKLLRCEYGTTSDIRMTLGCCWDSVRLDTPYKPIEECKPT